MSSLVNVDNCEEAGNWARGGCVTPAAPTGFFLHPTNSDLLSNANLATVALKKTALTTLLQNDTKTSRGTFIYKLVNGTFVGEEPQYETIDGQRRRTSNGTWDYEYEVEAATWCEYAKMLSYDGKHNKFRIILTDSENKAWGLKTDTGIHGYVLSALEVKPFKEPTYSSSFKLVIRIALADHRERTKDTNYFDLGFNPISYFQGKAVNDVLIGDVTTGSPGSGIFYISAKSVCGDATDGDNIVPTMATTWNVASAWKVIDGSGNAITISSVTILTTNGVQTAFILTLDTGDTDYSASDPAYVSLNTISSMPNQAYESNTVEITMN